MCVGLYGESAAIYTIFKRFEQNFCGSSIKINLKSPISTMFLVKTTLKTEGNHSTLMKYVLTILEIHYKQEAKFEFFFKIA